MKAALKYPNPWEASEGFVNLGPYELEGVHYDLYYMPRQSKPGVWEIGARYGEAGSYLSACIRTSRAHGMLRNYCFGYQGPIKEAVSRMAERGLFKVTIYDLNLKAIYIPSS